MARELHRTGLIAAALIVLALAGLACNLPNFRPAGGGTPEAEGTAPTYFIDPTLLTAAPTEDVAAETATPTLEAEAIPSPTGCGYWSEFVEDVTVPDGTTVTAGQTFEKTWRFRNNGCLAWPDTVQLVFWDGDQMAGPDAVDVPATETGETRDVTVTLTAPEEPGEYTGYWQLVAPGGVSVGPYVYVQVEVIAATASPTPEEEPASYEPFLGTWSNQTADTGDVAQFKISVDGDNLTVQRWDFCVAGICNQGTVTVPASDADDNILSLTWTGEEAGDEPSKTETQQLAILLDGRLQLTGRINYDDPEEEDVVYTDLFGKSADGGD